MSPQMTACSLAEAQRGEWGVRYNSRDTQQLPSNRHGHRQFLQKCWSLPTQRYRLRGMLKWLVEPSFLMSRRCQRRYLEKKPGVIKSPPSTRGILWSNPPTPLLSRKRCKERGSCSGGTAVLGLPLALFKNCFTKWWGQYYHLFIYI